ncbi:MAG: M14 family metallopeptidase [Caulobacteraceae bacterium]
MNAADSFAPDYARARAGFLAAAKEAGATLGRTAHPERGPNGGALSTDTAWIGPRDAERVLVTISGTHGAEGFCGSGAQVDWLTRGEAARLPKGMAALLIHAINPYGFAWLRRVTHENVDLNRNWIDFSAPLPRNPGYDELSEAICPARWDEAAQADSAGRLGAYVNANGPAALQAALSGGQYSHPAGVFYGGTGPSWSRRTQTAIFEHWLGGAARVAVIDYHTGLGPWGYGEQIVTDRRGSPGFLRAAAWYGVAVTSPNDGTSTSAPISGDGLAAAPRLLPKAEVTGMALEVGTRPLAQVFLALRADAWLHAHGDPASPEGLAIKARVRDAFFGDADDWKGMVAGQSLLACRQAVAGLQS